MLQDVKRNGYGQWKTVIDRAYNNFFVFKLVFLVALGCCYIVTMLSLPHILFGGFLDVKHHCMSDFLLALEAHHVDRA